MAFLRETSLRCSNSFVYVLIISDWSMLYDVLTELTLNPPEGIIAGPINEENFFEWEALIT